MKNKTFSIALSVVILGMGLFVSHVLVTNAQTTTVTTSASASSTIVSPSSLQYPIAALGNCGSVNDCRTYCNNPANENACLAFAEQNHLMTQEQVRRAQSFLSLIQSGGTPGNCSSAGECRTYCSDSSHASECLAFAEREGFVSQAQVQAIQQNAGKGPGGCDSEQSCTAFCNNPQNQSVCLNFAKQNGLISEVQAKNIQQSATGLKIGLTAFPGQVVSCLKGELGDNAVGELESGNITPNASTSAAVASCFNAYKNQIQNRFQNLIQNASTTVQGCLQNIGTSTISDLQEGNFGAIAPDMGERIKECLKGPESQAPEGEQSQTSTQEQNQNQEQNQGDTQNQERNRESIQNQLDGMNLPDRVKSCVQPYLLANPSSTNLGQIIASCVQAFGTSTQSGEGEGQGQGPAGMPVRTGGDNAPMIPATSSLNGILPQLQNMMNNRGGDNSGGGDN